jgi:hypothetical protein
MDPTLIGLRTQDFHESLKVVTTFGPKEVKFKNTLLIGKASSLAMHLRGLLYIEQYEQIEYAAASLGINSIELPVVLRELETIDFIRITKSGEQVKRIDVKVPEFRSGYSELGKRWQDLRPNELEQAGIASLEHLHHGPVAVPVLQSQYSLNSNEFAIMRDVMMCGQLLAIQTVDGTPTAYSPLAVDGNPSAYLQWAKRFPNEVTAAIETLTQSQGLAMSDGRIASNKSLMDAIQTGVIMPVTVSGATGAQRFLFAPRGGLAPEEKTILDKSRAILSCVRYGQSFSQGVAIKYPRRILEVLRDNKQFNRGHPDLMSQYGLLAEKLIGHPFEESSNRWNFRIDDTDENMKALNIAIEMLEYGTSSSVSIDLDAQKALLSPSQYQGPASTRPRMTSDPVVSKETRADIIRELTKLTRGMNTHG